MAIYCWPAAGNMTSGCHLRSSAKYLWQTDKVLASPCSPHSLPCWLVLEAINQNQLHFTLQPIFRVWRHSLVLGLPRHSVQTSNLSLWGCHRVFHMICLTLLFCFHFTSYSANYFYRYLTRCKLVIKMAW